MDISPVKLVYFSPTGTSKRIAEAIAEGIKAPVRHLDLTLPAAKALEPVVKDDELAVIAAPVYSGRLPHEAKIRLKRLQTDDTPAVLVVVYGNRHYDDALLELQDLSLELGLMPLAGGAFIGEHSFSTAETPIAQGRPDEEDLEKASEFGRKIREKMKRIGTQDIPPIEVPGNRPYRIGRRQPDEPMDPFTKEDICTKCGTCAEVCPTSAVTVGDAVTTEGNDCIWCCACVKSCPSGARTMRPRMLRSMERLHANCSERREPETFL